MIVERKAFLSQHIHPCVWTMSIVFFLHILLLLALFSPLFPFVRPLVTDSNLPFDANNICPICSYLRRKKQKKRRNFRRKKRASSRRIWRKKTMDIVHTHGCMCWDRNAFRSTIIRRKERMSSICTRIEHNSVVDAFLTRLIHRLSLKYIHSNHSVIFFLTILCETKVVNRNDTISAFFLSFALLYSLVNYAYR